jgi:hypothetical protein
VVSSDCDLLIRDDDDDAFGISLDAFVFLIMTCERPDIGPTVVALWIDTRLATVPEECQWSRWG